MTEIFRYRDFSIKKQTPKVITFNVECSKDETMIEVKMKLVEKLLEEKEIVGEKKIKIEEINLDEILIFDIYEHFAYHFFSDDKYVKQLNNTETLYAYQISPFAEKKDEISGKTEKEEQKKSEIKKNDKNIYILQILFRIFDKKQNTVKLFGQPLIMKMDEKMMEKSSKELKAEFWKYIFDCLEITEKKEEYSKKFPFKIKTTSKSGKLCSVCDSSMKCKGCLIPDNLSSFFNQNQNFYTFSFDFSSHLNPSFLSSLFPSSQLVPSPSSSSSSSQISILDCLNLFTTEEILSVNDTW